MYPPKMGIVKVRKLSVRPKIILFSKMVQDYGKRSADICLDVQAVGKAGLSLSMRYLRSLWTELTYCEHPFTKSYKMLQFQVESFEYLRMSIDDVLRLDEDIESPTIPGEHCQ